MGGLSRERKILRALDLTRQVHAELLRQNKEWAKLKRMIARFEQERKARARKRKRSSR